MNTVRNIRIYLARLAGISCLLALTALGGSANVSCNVQGGVATLRLLVGTAPGVWTRTNVFQVPPSASAQTVTNTITNLVVGVNYIAAQAVSSNGLASDLSTNLQVTVPAAPDNIQTVPLSLVVPVGVPIQISRDGEHFFDRILIQPAPNPEAFAAAGASSPPPVSAPSGSLILVTYRSVPDQPALFFRQQPPASLPPLP